LNFTGLGQEGTIRICLRAVVGGSRESSSSEDSDQEAGGGCPHCRVVLSVKEIQSVEAEGTMSMCRDTYCNC